MLRVRYEWVVIIYELKMGAVRYLHKRFFLFSTVDFVFGHMMIFLILFYLGCYEWYMRYVNVGSTPTAADALMLRVNKKYKELMSYETCKLFGEKRYQEC